MTTSKDLCELSFLSFVTQEGISVAYWRFPQLLEKMTEAFNRNESNALRRRINSKRLLIIDDFAMAPLNDQMRTDLLSL